MNKQDIELVNSKMSDIQSKIFKALEVLQDLKKTHKHSRLEAEKILDELTYDIPFFIEVKNDH